MMTTRRWLNIYQVLVIMKNWKLETAYFKSFADNIKDTYPKSYKKLMDFIKEFETEEIKD